MGAAQGGAGVPGVPGREEERGVAHPTRRSAAVLVARWLGLGFREVSARCGCRALEIYSTTEWGFQGAELRATMSRRCARVRGVVGCQKVAAPSSTLTGTRGRLA